MTELEFFDSEDPEYEATVFDANDRKVILKVWELEIVCFKLSNNQQI